MDGVASPRKARRGALAVTLLAALLTLLAGLPAAAQAQSPTLSVNDVTVDPEGNSGTKLATFTVTLSQASESSVSVTWATSDGTATGSGAGADFAGVAGTTVTFTPGQTTRTFNVTINGDVRDEENETFSVVLSAPTGGATIDDGTGTGTIVDDDAPPALSVADVSVAESASTIVFTVTLTPASGKTVTVGYTTLDGTASSLGMGADYAPAMGTLTFTPGDTTEVATITLAEDAVDELDETFTLQLSNPVNATISDATATGTIRDNEGPAISIGDVTIDPEGNSGTKIATFQITIPAPSTVPVTVSYATQNGTAVGTGATPDFVPVSTATPVTIPAGQTSVNVAITVNGDATDENDETFEVRLSSPRDGATIADDGIGVGTIVDDDAQPTLIINDVSQKEGTSIAFTVTLSAASGKTVTVEATTVAQTATGGNVDYVDRSAPGTVTISPGAVTASVSVTVTNDAEDEADETFLMQLANASNATIVDASGTGTIVDDDGPNITVDDINVNEGTGGTTNATFTLTLSKQSPDPVSVKIKTENDAGAATAPADYTALTGTTATIPAGQTTGTVVVPVAADEVDEPDERFRIKLEEMVGGGTITKQTGQATIIDDDDVPRMRIDDVSVNEGSIGSPQAIVTVSMNRPSGRTIIVAYTTADVSATAGVDYADTTNVLTFNPGDTTKTIAIPIGADGLVENDETFTVTMTTSSLVTLERGEATVTIVDDDLNANTSPALSVADASVTEGDSGTRPLTFTVRVTPTPGRKITLSYTTDDRTARAPADYTHTAGQLVIPAGETTATIEVPVQGDVAVEGTQSFSLTLSDPANATISDASAIGTIRDDDVGLGPVTVPASVRAPRLLCAQRRGCAGLAVGFTVYARGTLTYDLSAVVPRRRSGSKAVIGTRLVRLVRTSSTINSPRSGRKLLRPTPGRRARRLLAQLRRDGATSLRLQVRFTNRTGGAQTVTKSIPLRLR